MGDIYAKYDRVDRAFSKLNNSDLSRSNRRELKRFGEYLMAQNLSSHKIYRYLQTFRVLSHEIDFNLSDASHEQVIRLVGKINQNKIEGKDYRPESKAELKKALKRFYKWDREGENPEIVRFMSTHVKHSNRKKIDPGKLPSYKEVKYLIDAAKNPRDRAAVYFLWESGARVGEFLSLDWQDIALTGDLIRVDLDGKTGKRTIPVKECREDLETWKNWQKDGLNPVISSLQGGDRLAYSSFQQQLKRLKERAEVDCKVNPHAFRKSRATYLASHGANVFQLMEFFGWSKAETAKTYVRLAQSDVDRLVKDVSNF